MYLLFVFESEFPTPRDKRMQYVSGFTGSSATIVIEEGAAAFWTDSRYYAQAESQLDNDTWKLMKIGMPSVPSIEQWLVETLPANSRVGIDPFLITSKRFQKLDEYLKANGHKLESVQQNLVDAVWKNRPELKLKELEPIEHTFSGTSIQTYSYSYLFIYMATGWLNELLTNYRFQFFF